MISCLSICLLATVIPISDALKLANSIGMNQERPFEIRGQVTGIAKGSFSIICDFARMSGNGPSPMMQKAA